MQSLNAKLLATTMLVAIIMALPFAVFTVYGSQRQELRESHAPCISELFDEVLGCSNNPLGLLKNPPPAAPI